MRAPDMSCRTRGGGDPNAKKPPAPPQPARADARGGPGRSGGQCVFTRAVHRGRARRRSRRSSAARATPPTGGRGGHGLPCVRRLAWLCALRAQILRTAAQAATLVVRRLLRSAAIFCVPWSCSFVLACAAMYLSLICAMRCRTAWLTDQNLPTGPKTSAFWRESLVGRSGGFSHGC